MSSNDSEKIVPPKKSKAARKTEEKKDDKVSNHGSEEADKSKENENEKNIFNEELIVEGKRKRNSPHSEQYAKDWLQKHLVESDSTLILFTSDIYKCYVESCTSNGGVPLVESEFLKIMKSLFPKGYALSPECPYKDAIRKKKVHKFNAAKMKVDSLQLKMKDIIIEAIMSLGNPRRGVSMAAMRNYVMGKYPALRLDQREGFKRAVLTQMRYKKIECVRGIGACGFYRLPRTPDQESEEIAKEKLEAKEKLQKKKEKLATTKKKQEVWQKESAGEDVGDGDKVAIIELSDDGKDADEGDEDEDSKEKAGGGDGVAEDSKDEENKDGTIAADDIGNEKDGKKDKKKKKKKAKKSHSQGSREFLDFENPTRIEDTFPLAMTYNCEPKESSIVKITKYLIDFYEQDLSKEKLKKCLELGIEKNYWTQVSGLGSGSGSYRLTINEFDPNADNDLTGMIMNAIVACTEPKVSSASLLKRYIQEYHPELKVIEQPRRFKLALQRAITSNKIKQLSGIGATGSFQLNETFRPGPSVLQGKGSMDWPSSGNGSDDEDLAGIDAEDGGAELYQDAYRPRPSKRRGMGRAADITKVFRLDMSAYPSLKKIKTNGTGNGLTTRRSASSSRSRPSAPQAARKLSKRPAPQDDDDDEEEEDDEDEDEEPEYVPKKSRTRGSVAKSNKKVPSGDDNKKSTRKSSPVKAMHSEKASKIGPPKAKKSKTSSATRSAKVPEAIPTKLEARAAKKRVSYVEADDVDDDDEEEEEEEEAAAGALNMASSPRKAFASPRKASLSRGTRNNKVAKTRSNSTGNQVLTVVLSRDLDTSNQGMQKGSGKGAKAAKRAASTAVTSDGSKEAAVTPSKGKKRKKKSRGRY